MSSSDVETFYETYNDLIHKLEHGGAGLLGMQVHNVNKKLLAAVSDEIKGTTSEIATTAAAGLASSNEFLAEARDLPGTIKKEIATMPAALHVEKLLDIATSIRMLLTSFQAALENPYSVFPQLACVGVPVEPAHLSNFKKRHLRVQRLNEEDPELNQGERSMPTAPKSGLDVITNVTSSIESFGDDVLASVESVTRSLGEIEKLREAADDLKTAIEPVTELFKQQEAIRNLISHISSIFQAEDKDTSEAARELRDKPTTSLVDFIKEASASLEAMKETGEALECTLSKIQAASGSLSSLTHRLRNSFSLAVEHFSQFVMNLKRLKANLPRIARELQQFFVPSGLRYFILRPSHVLLALLQSIEDIKTCLSEPEAAATFSVDVLSTGASAKKLEAVKSKLDDMQLAPRKLHALVEGQDIRSRIAESSQKALKEVCSDIGSDVLEGAVSGALQAVGAQGLADQIPEPLQFLVGGGGGQDDGPGNPSASTGLSTKISDMVSLPWNAQQLFR